MTVFSDVLTRLLRHDAGRPLVTFYDEATGERTELSVATYANWVAKAGSLLVDELGLERGDRLRVDLPAHWLTVVSLGAAWSTGLVVTDEAADGGRPDAVVTGPDGLARWSSYPSTGSGRGTGIVLACSLLPLGVRFAEPLPAGVHDVGVEIWSQPDSFVPWDPPSGEDPAVAFGDAIRSHEQLWEAAAAGSTGGDRLLSEVNPASPPGLSSLTEPLTTGGSVVLVAHADPDRLEAIAVAERVTDRFPRVQAEDR
ncbi:TIGR03089 family protein [Nocardioides sp. CER19]|uniref:TIGR03089 family protein n=1 Tax=Nocardioides sp. CER19 TaxID=3038538 RepID=UPI002449A642|nr:TIGR03089 family protein [Nocardioides sp. CER19]MDH2415112.1 TIGR03089 family protein [Nocardioides sp. CER19]